MSKQHAAGLRPVGREIHCVDVENLLGTPHFDAKEAQTLAAHYALVAVNNPAAQITVAASNSASLLTAGLAWPATRRVWRRGQDGADLALLEVLETEDVAARFTRVVIGSGDGIFTTAAAHLAASGCRVVVIARRGHLSHRLRMAAHEVHYLDTTTFAAEVAAEVTPTSARAA